MSETPYAFFVSYARHVDQDLVAEFFDDLDVEVRLLLGRDRKDAGFLDREGLYPGDDWEQVLIERARTAHSMIALLSADYGRSRWCGREWGIFAERIERLNAPPGAPHARCLMPFRWSGAATPPAAVAKLHSTHRGLGGDLLIDLKRAGGPPYLKAVAKIARWIAGADALALPPLGRAEARAVPPAFGDPSTPASPPPLPAAAPGRVPMQLKERLVNALYMVGPIRSGEIGELIRLVEDEVGILDIGGNGPRARLVSLVQRALAHEDTTMLDSMLAGLRVQAPGNDPALPRVAELIRQIKDIRYP
ncbi:TIR domain-containing protein [Actinomadura sp. NPDC000600]|uniref:TIR domain-containing protein n=1 Tax=Actinomadura sp. NPDC000600 TaxID=3154262 RepID=UPI0033949629